MLTYHPDRRGSYTVEVSLTASLQQTLRQFQEQGVPYQLVKESARDKVLIEELTVEDRDRRRELIADIRGDVETVPTLTDERSLWPIMRVITILPEPRDND